MPDHSRTKVRFFMSYAHENAQLAGRFKNLILEQMGPSKGYEYEIWQDEEQLLPGVNWAEGIRDALQECDLGLLLISPSFLNSKFITDHELPVFVGNNAKACIPVMLGPINLKRHDLKGLKTAQIFRFKTSNGHYKNLSDCNPRQRGQFCEQLFDQIENRLDKLSPKN
jgi:hypothetical protein